MRSTALAVDFGHFLRGGIKEGSSLGPMIEFDGDENTVRKSVRKETDVKLTYSI